ncbi:MAG: peptidase MA family metallohydrolase [Chloroflexi bacterium]|nr:peptidase MA family metallohydrolase [Chloroflexota bacterium]PWB48092.1 MAG: hypothetical protein C3F10_01590 [Dehalococcoidia bacterium]
MIRKLAGPLFVAFVAVLSIAPFPGHASAQTVVESSTVENGYPKTLTFKLTARADSDITDVTLEYSIKGRGTSALGKPKELTPARNLSTEVELQANSGQAYIPVGSEFTFRWKIETTDGKTYTSPDQQFFYLPPDKDWQSVSNDFMTVYYHGDRATLASAYLKAGEETYERIGKGLYNVTLTTLPVKVILFANEQESDLARPGTGGSFDAAVTTCGTKVTNDILLLIPVPCGSTDRTDTLRHELGHILNETAGEGALGKLPSWLDEGAAVYAQSSPGDYQAAFEAAVRANRLIPFNQMGNPATTASQVGVFYGQSYSMVNYLIENKGEATFGEFMSTIKRGSRFDDALKSVYSFADLSAFEDEFRASFNLAPLAGPTAAPTQRPQQSQPTVAPTAPPSTGVSSATDDDRSLGRGTFIIVGVAVLFALAAVFAYLLALMAANSRLQAAQRAAPPPRNDDDWRPPQNDGPFGG